MKPVSLLAALCLLICTWSCQKPESELLRLPTETNTAAVQEASTSAITTTRFSAIQESSLSEIGPTNTAYSIKYSKVTIANYGTCNMITYTPAGASQSTKLPVVVFVPGNGQCGTDASKLYTYGPLKYINSGWRPNFIVVGIQPLFGCSSASPRFAHNMLTAIRKNPLVDTNRVYLTGLSGGAFTVLHYVRDYPTPYRIRAVFAFSIDMTSSTRDARFANVPAWGMAGTLDTRFQPKMKSYFNGLILKGYRTRYNDYVGGHGGWNTFYNPTWTKDGYSLYSWLLKWK